MEKPARKLTAVIAACACLASLSGCISGSGGENTSETTEKSIRFGYIKESQMHSPGVMVTKEKKLLEAAGISVEWVEYPAGAYEMTDMAGGSLDFACCGCVPVMSAQAEHGGLAIIAGANQEGSSLVVNSTITAVSDLHGKKIATPGVGSIQDLLLGMLAFNNEIKIRNVAVKVSDMPILLKKGEIDGFIAWAPHPERAAFGESGYEILAIDDTLPGYQCCVIAASENMMGNDFETVEKVMDVYFEAYRWFLENHDESIKMFSAATGVSEDIIRESIKTVSYPDIPYCDIGSMEIMAHSLIEIDKITSVNQTDVASFIDELYRPEFLQRYSG